MTAITIVLMTQYVNWLVSLSIGDYSNRRDVLLDLIPGSILVRAILAIWHLPWSGER